LGPDTTTSEVLKGIDLRGRNAIVTGASGGLGAETARALAEKGANITLTARDPAKAAPVAEAVRSESAGGSVEVAELDLTSLESVREFAARFNEAHEELHILVDNAGIMACPLARTEQGWELQFATNHLGHFLLTGLLVPALRAGAPSRIVIVSSAAHLLSPVNFDDVHFERRDYDKWVAYAQSKTANVLFAHELNRRLQADGVTANALHPGVIMTELARHLTPDDIKDMMERSPDEAPLRFKTVPAGAATSVWAATAPELEGRGGLYLEDCGIGEPAGEEAPGTGYAPHAFDPEAARALWDLSEKLVGECFEFSRRPSRRRGPEPHASGLWLGRGS
jgi:NAD(P)-dependent dehydrogenase (short-subunit alcohol dehydrogenase family)